MVNVIDFWNCSEMPLINLFSFLSDNRIRKEIKIIQFISIENTDNG